MTQTLSGVGIALSPNAPTEDSTATQARVWRLVRKAEAKPSPYATSRSRRSAAKPRNPSRPLSPPQPQRRYFVHMLVGVYPSHEVAMMALSKNEFARDLPVAVERNSNGLGQCKTWLAVSKPFLSRGQAQEAQRRLTPFVGQGAVTVRMEARK